LDGRGLEPSRRLRELELHARRGRFAGVEPAVESPLGGCLPDPIFDAVLARVHHQLGGIYPGQNDDAPAAPWLLLRIAANRWKSPDPAPIVLAGRWIVLKRPASVPIGEPAVFDDAPDNLVARHDECDHSRILGHQGVFEPSRISSRLFWNSAVRF